MAHFHDENQQDSVADLVENPVIAHANPVGILDSRQLLGARRSWGVLQGINYTFEACLNIAGQFSEGARRVGVECDLVRHSEIALPLQGFPIHTLAWLHFRFSDSLKIHMVFESFEQGVVFYGNQHRHVSIPTLKDNSFAMRRNKIERFRNVLFEFAC